MTNKGVRTLGATLLVFGVAFNKFTVQMFAPDGRIEGIVINLLILILQLSIVIPGVYLLMRPNRSSVVNLALLYISSFLTVLGAEAGVRLFVFGSKGISYRSVASLHSIVHSDFVKNPSHVGLPYELKANVSGIFTMAEFRTNSIGLLDDEVLTAQADAVKVAVLGDSFTAPAGIELRDAWHTLLEEKSKKSSPECDWSYINFGVYGYELPQYIVMLRERALPLAPDLVIVGFCAENDHIIVEDNPKPWLLEPKSGFFQSYLLKLILCLQYEPFERLNRVPTDSEQAYILQKLTRIRELADTVHAPVLVAYLATVPRDATVVQQLAESAGCYFVDVSKAFEGKPPTDYTLFHPIDSHPNVAANVIFSDVIFEKLQEFGLIGDLCQRKAAEN